MSQKFQVLKCFKCCTFQVHSVKKSTKWACKMCGENQSLKRNYGIGTGKECRLHVQRLNSIRWEIAESRDCLETLEFNEEGTENSESWKNVESKKCIPSKWDQYVEPEKEPPPKLSEENASTFEGAEVVLELPKNIRKKRLNKTTNNITKRLKPLNPDADQPETMHVLSNDNVHTKFPASKLFVDEIPSNLNEGKLIDHKFKVFEPCKLSKNSKWAKFVDENAEVEEVDDHSSDACKVFEQPEVTKNSKWAKFVDENAEVEEVDDHSSDACKFLEQPEVTKNSKWAKFVDENAEVEEVEDHSSDACKVLEHPEVTKNSKWSQYVHNVGVIEDAENDESRESTSAVNFSVEANVKGISFSQCSDEDIDRVLDF